MSLALSMRSGSLRSASLIFLITGSVRSLQIPSTWASPTTTTMLEWVSDALLICSAMWTFLSSMSFLTRVGYFLRIASTYLSSSSAKLSWTASTLRLPPMESDMPERRYLILSEADISSHISFMTFIASVSIGIISAPASLPVFTAARNSPPTCAPYSSDILCWYLAVCL